MNITYGFIFGIFTLLIYSIITNEIYKIKTDKYEENIYKEYASLFLSNLQIYEPKLYNQLELWEGLYHSGRITKAEYLNNINKIVNFYHCWRDIEKKTWKELLAEKKQKEILENSKVIKSCIFNSNWYNILNILEKTGKI